MLSALENIYISPLELCNLHCQYCYTNKTKNILTNKQILSFVKRYDFFLRNRSHVFFKALNVASPHSQRQKKYDEISRLKSIIFCGGEVFTLKSFPTLINKLNSMGIFVSIITNGTIDRLDEIENPQNCQLIVSFDGPEAIHNQNRGPKTFATSLSFVHHALDRGFPVEIFYLITRDSYPYRHSFPRIFRKLAFVKKASDIHFTYLTDRLGSLSPVQIREIRQKYPVFPPRNFGCSQLSLQSDGNFYGCCESSKAIASLSDPVKKIVANFVQATSTNSLCCDPNYFCDLKNIKK